MVVASSESDLPAERLVLNIARVDAGYTAELQIYNYRMVKLLDYDLIATKTACLVGTLLLLSSSLASFGRIWVPSSEPNSNIVGVDSTRVTAHIRRNISSKHGLRSIPGLSTRSHFDFLVPCPHEKLILSEQQVSLEAISRSSFRQRKLGPSQIMLVIFR
jgi:hypothetical protein